MTDQRRVYVVALVVAVTALIGSVGVSVAYAPNSNQWSGSPTRQADTDHWPMMGRGDSGYGDGMHGGMMGQGRGESDGEGQLTLVEAKKLADDWLSKNQPGASADRGIQMPMGHIFTVTKDGQTIGMVMVNDDSGQVGFHAVSSPTPVPTGGS